MTKDKLDVPFAEKLLNAAGKLADYERYFMTLVNIDDEYDETMELYKLAEWYGEAGSTIAGKASHMLRVTSELFQDMRNNAVHELFHVIKDIAALPAADQIELCGTMIEPSILEKEGFEDMMAEWEEYPYHPREARDSFLEHMRNYFTDDADRITINMDNMGE